jgi:riboflavin kinase / FMN adenylyltransferase
LLPVSTRSSQAPARVKIIRLARELQVRPNTPICAAIGVFDGLHLGHQAVLRKALDEARATRGLALAITFDRHPNTVVAPHRVPPLIQSLRQRLRGLETAGFDVTWLIPFDAAFSRIPPDTFIQNLVQDVGQLSNLSVGTGFTFGHKRAGNLDLLQQLGARLGFAVHGIQPVALDGQPVSSTRIRNAIRAGHLDQVHALLGRHYAIAGPVVRGAQLGRQLGFPTANLDVTALALPPSGVYAATTSLNSAKYAAVLNIGRRPTIEPDATETRFEVHILDFSGDLYDRDLEVALHHRLRDEQRFPSLTDLQRQIHADIEAARLNLAHTLFCA